MMITKKGKQKEVNQLYATTLLLMLKHNYVTIAVSFSYFVKRTHHQMN